METENIYEARIQVMVAKQMIRAAFGENTRHLVLDMLSLKCLLNKWRKQVDCLEFSTYLSPCPCRGLTLS